LGWDGAGGYTRQHNFSADASAGINILAARMDTELNDVASAMTLAWARNGQNVPAQDMPMGGRKFVNVGAPTSVSDFIRSREFIENVPIFMQDAESSADRISVSSQYFTSVSANQAPSDGTKIMVRVNSNKSSAVMYVDGHSANVEYQDGNRIGAALLSGGIYEFTYSSVDTAWKVPAPGDGRTAAEIAAGVTPTNYQYLEGEALRYGYRADDSTDNTTAIQNAIDVMDAAGGGIALLPEGTGRFASTITLKQFVSLQGQGAGATVIRYTGSGVALVNEDVGANAYNYSTWKNFTLTTTTSSPSVGPGTHGIRALNAHILTISGVEVRGFSTAGVHLQATGVKFVGYVTIEGECHIHENQDGILCGDVNSAINNISIKNSAIRANLGWNIYSAFDMLGWSISGCALEGAGTGAVYFSGVSGLELHSNYFEQSDGLPAIHISDTRASFGISIKSNYFQGDGTGTAVIVGTSALVHGVEVATNSFVGWTTGITLAGATRGVIGPNFYSSVTTNVGTPGSNSTELIIIDGSSVRTYNAPISQFAWDGSAWNAFPAYRYLTVPLGSVAYGSLGTNTTPVAGTIYYAELHIEKAMTVTGVGFLTGAASANDAWIVSLYSATGTKLANSALAGGATVSNNALNEFAFTAPLAVAPGKYWVGLQTNGTTDRFRTVAASTFADLRTKSAVGAFGTLPALTVPTTFTADVGPIAYVY
jgi:hypothetical protein